MFILGIVGIFQVLLFPGLIFRKFFTLPKGFWIRFSAIVGISLIANYLFVFITTILGIFTQITSLIAVALEIIAILYLYRKDILSIKISDFLASVWDGLISPIHKIFPKINAEDEEEKSKAILNIFAILLFVAALIAIELIFRVFRYNIGQIFTKWDAVLSWNKWAAIWATNTFPVNTEDYPQLIPTNWAMIYALIGNNGIQFFAKAIMPLFPLLIMFVLLSLGIQTNNPGFFISIITLRLVFKKFLTEYLASGYMDIPLTFFGFMAIIFLWYVYKEKDEAKKFRWWILSTLFSSGAAITKQAGLYILGLDFLLGFYFVFGIKIKLAFATHWKKILIIVAIILVIAVPWYGIKAVQFALGESHSHIAIPIQSTNRVHQEDTLIDTAISALQGLGKYFYFFLLAIPAFLFIDNFWRWILVLFVIPYTLIWSAYASYDTRNLAITFPIYTTIIGLGLWGFSNWFLALLKKIKFFKVPLFIPLMLLIGGLLIGLNYTFSESYLSEKQIERQRQLFSPGLNEQLLAYFDDSPEDLKVLTVYPLDLIPGLHGQVNFAFNDLGQFEDYINSGEIDYVLYPQYTNQEIKDAISTGEETGRFTFILSNSDWIPYTLISVNSDSD